MTTPAYITLEDLRSLFAASEIDALTGPGVNAAALISATNAEVHSYVAGLIGTAVLAEVPVALKMPAADIVRYRLYTDTVDKDGPIAARWQAALKYLAQVANRTVSLGLVLADNPGTDGDDVAEAVGVWSEPGSALPASEWSYL